MGAISRLTATATVIPTSPAGGVQGPNLRKNAAPPACESPPFGRTGGRVEPSTRFPRRSSAERRERRHRPCFGPPRASPLSWPGLTGSLTRRLESAVAMRFAPRYASATRPRFCWHRDRPGGLRRLQHHVAAMLELRRPGDGRPGRALSPGTRGRAPAFEDEAVTPLLLKPSPAGIRPPRGPRPRERPRLEPSPARRPPTPPRGPRPAGGPRLEPIPADRRSAAGAGPARGLACGAVPGRPRRQAGRE